MGTVSEVVVEITYKGACNSAWAHSLAYMIIILGFHPFGGVSLCLQVLTVLCNVVEKGPAYCQQLWPGPLLSCLLNTLVLSDTEVVGQSLELLQLLFLYQPEVGLVSQSLAQKLLILPYNPTC